MIIKDDGGSHDQALDNAVRPTRIALDGAIG